MSVVVFEILKGAENVKWKVARPKLGTEKVVTKDISSPPLASYGGRDIECKREAQSTDDYWKIEKFPENREIENPL